MNITKINAYSPSFGWVHDDARVLATSSSKYTSKQRKLIDKFLKEQDDVINYAIIVRQNNGRGDKYALCESTGKPNVGAEIETSNDILKLCKSARTKAGLWRKGDKLPTFK